MVERDHRRDAVLVACRQHAPVMIELCQGELSLFRLDARPLQGEAVEGEAQISEQGDVLAVAVIVIAGVARRLDVRAARHVLHDPVVIVDVAAFHLVRGGGGAPEERGRKSDLHHRLLLSQCSRGTHFQAPGAFASSFAPTGFLWCSQYLLLYHFFTCSCQCHSCVMETVPCAV